MDNIYVMSIEARSGKTLAALGLMELASRRVERVGFFRPVIRDGDQPDPIIELMRARYGLAKGPEQLYGLRYADARELAESGRREEALQHILERYERVASDCDVVICDGTDYSAVSAPFEFAFNAQIASHLGASIFFVRLTGKAARSSPPSSIACRPARSTRSASFARPTGSSKILSI